MRTGKDGEVMPEGVETADIVEDAAIKVCGCMGSESEGSGVKECRCRNINGLLWTWDEASGEKRGVGEGNCDGVASTDTVRS